MPAATQKGKKMSAPTPTETKPTINVTGYNDQLVLETKEIPYDFTPVEENDYEGAMKRLGNDVKLAVVAINTFLEERAQKEARAAAGMTIRKADVLAFAAPYRQLPQFASITPRSAQTAAIAKSKLATSPAMIAALKDLAASAKGPDSTEGE